MAIKNEPGRDPADGGADAKLNVVFALTSIALLITFSLMIWADYDREWKKYQNAFTDMEVQLTRKQIEEALGKVDADRRQELEAELAQGEQEWQPRADGDRGAAGRARDSSRASGTGWTRTTGSPRPTSTWPATSTRRPSHHEARAARPKKKAPGRAGEPVEGPAPEAGGRGARGAAAARAKLAELEKTRLEAEKTQKELYAEKTRLEERLKKIERGVRVVRAQHAGPGHGQPLAEGQPDHAREPLRRRDLHAHAQGGPLHHLPPGHRQEGLREAPQPYTTHPTWSVPARARTRWRGSAARLPPGPRAGPRASRPPPTSPPRKEQEKAWGKYTGSDTYHRCTTGTCP